MKTLLILFLLIGFGFSAEFADTDTVYVVVYLNESLPGQGDYTTHAVRCEYGNFGVAEGCLNVRIDDGDGDYRVYIYDLRNISEYTVSRDCIWMGHRMFRSGWLGRIVK